MLVQVLSDFIVWYDDVRYYVVNSLFQYAAARNGSQPHQATLPDLLEVFCSLAEHGSSWTVPIESVQWLQGNFYGMSLHGYPHYCKVYSVAPLVWICYIQKICVYTYTYSTIILYISIPTSNIHSSYDPYRFSYSLTGFIHPCTQTKKRVQVARCKRADLDHLDLDLRWSWFGWKWFPHTRWGSSCAFRCSSTEGAGECVCGQHGGRWWKWPLSQQGFRIFRIVQRQPEDVRRACICRQYCLWMFVDQSQKLGTVQVVRYPRTTSEQTYCNSMAYFKQESWPATILVFPDC